MVSGMTNNTHKQKLVTIQNLYQDMTDEELAVVTSNRTTMRIEAHDLSAFCTKKAVSIRDRPMLDAKAFENPPLSFVSTLRAHKKLREWVGEPEARPPVLNTPM